MSRSNISIFLLICLIFIIGCVSCGKVEDKVPIDYSDSTPPVDFLEIVELTTTEKLREDELHLFIENKTNDCIVFPNDYGAQIFTRINATWVQIPNLVEYMNETEIVLTTYPGERPFISIYLLPDYSEINGTPKEIRVILHAFLCQNGNPSDKMVSDYIDIDLVK